VDQSEEYRTIDMEARDGTWRAVIPAGFTSSSFPIMFFAEIRPPDGVPVLAPTLGEHLDAQPYIVVHSTAAKTTADE
jgi:hypothetical protein